MSNNKLTKKVINKVFWRNIFAFQYGWNYVRMQGLGYAYTMMPALRALYADKPEMMQAAVKTHLGFFNTTPAMSNLIVGANLAFEEEMGHDETAVMGLKTGLMGPFAGIGDTIFIAIYRSVIFSIAAYMALANNVVGLLIPLITGAIVVWARYKFTYLGYAQGRKLVTELVGKMQLITEGASILGLTVVGGLIPAVIKYKTDVVFTAGEVTFELQSMFDKIMPGLLPLLIVFFSYWLLGKKWMNSTRLLFVLMLGGILLGNVQNIINYLGGMG